MKIYYQNNQGQSVEFMGWPYKISQSNLFDYGWGYESIGENKINRFKREIQDKSLIISVAAASRKEYDRAAAYLYEVVEKDVLSGMPGRLYVNDSYLSCYRPGLALHSWRVCT